MAFWPPACRSIRPPHPCPPRTPPATWGAQAELNRTPPPTQAARQQAMHQCRVSPGGEAYARPVPFLVFATQNPIAHKGTYPLPEAQLDRFMSQIYVRYPPDAEKI